MERRNKETDMNFADVQGEKNKICDLIITKSMQKGDGHLKKAVGCVSSAADRVVENMPG